VLVVMVKYT